MDLESSSGFSGADTTVIHPPGDNTNEDPTSGGRDHLPAGDANPSSAVYTKPIVKPRRSGWESNVVPLIPPPPKSPSDADSPLPTCPPPLPSHVAPTPPSPQPLSHESGLPAVTVPSPPSAPAPPPLPYKAPANSKQPTTKAFHWDVVGSEKVTFSIMLRWQ